MPKNISKNGELPAYVLDAMKKKQPEGELPSYVEEALKKKEVGGVEQKASSPSSSQSNIPLPSLSQQGFPTVEPTLLPTGNLTTNILPEAQKEEQRKTQQEYIKINNDKIAAFEKAANPFLNNKQSGLIAPETNSPIAANETPLQITKMNHLIGVADVFVVNANGGEFRINSLDLPIDLPARTSDNVNRYVNDLVTRLRDPKLNGTPQREADYKEIKGLDFKVQNAIGADVFSKDEQTEFVKEAAKYGIEITEPFGPKWREYAKQYKDAIQKSITPKYEKIMGKEGSVYVDENKLKQDEAYLAADDIEGQITAHTANGNVITKDAFLKRADQSTAFEKFTNFIGKITDPNSSIVEEAVNYGLSLDKVELGADFYVGLDYYKSKNPVLGQRIENMLKNGTPIPSATKNEITSKGLEILDARNANDFAEGRRDIDNTLKNQEAFQKAYQKNNLDSRDILVAKIGDNMSEYFDKKSQQQGFNAYDPHAKIFGTRWMYTDKEIDEAAPIVAKELGLDINDSRVKDAVNFIKKNEGFMIGQNGIKKDGLVRSFFRGAATPISGTVATVEGWGKDTDTKFSESQNQSNASFAEGRVQREKSGVLRVVNDAVDGFGQFATQAALMYAGGAAFNVIGKAAGASTEGGTLLGNAIVKGEQSLGIVSSSFLQSYDSNLKSVMNMTTDNTSAQAGATVLSFAEGFSELILPDVEIGRQIIRNFSKESTGKILNLLTKESIQKGLTNDTKKELISIVKDGMVKGAASMGQEVSEELITQTVNYAVNAYLNPAQAKERNLAGELGETAIQTMVQMAIPVLGGIRGGVGNDAMRKGAIMVAAQNSGRLGEIINAKIASGEITQEDGNAQLRVINTAAAVNAAMPNKFNGDKLGVEEKANYIFSRTREAVLNDRIKDEQDEVIVKEVKSEITKEQQIRRDILQGTPETNPSSVITSDRNTASDQSVINSTPAPAISNPVITTPVTVNSLTSIQQEKVVEALSEEDQVQYESAVENGTGEEFLLAKYNEVNNTTPAVTPNEDAVFIKELVDQKLIPSIDQSMVAPDGVFDQSKVEGYLQFVSDQTKDVGEEAMLNKGYPKQLIDLAVSMQPKIQTTNAATTTAVNKSVESNTTGIQQGENTTQVASQELVAANSDQGSGNAAAVQLNENAPQQETPVADAVNASQPIGLSTVPELQLTPEQDATVAVNQPAKNLEQPVAITVDKKSKPVIGDKILWRDSEYIVTAVNKNGSFNANNGQLYVKEGVLSDKEYGGIIIDKPAEDIKSKGKKIADKIRKASIRSSVAQSNILGIPIAIYNAAVITVANAVELGATIAQAVDEAIKKHNLDSYEKFSKDKLVKYLESLSGIEPLTLSQRKLITSIELRRKKGMTDAQIKEDMLSVGKTEEQIDFAFNAGNVILEAEAQREDRRNKNEILNAKETFLSSIGDVIIDQANFGLSGLSTVTEGMTSEAIDAIQNTEGDMQLSDTKLTTYLSGKTIEKTIGFLDDLSLLKTNDQVVAAMSLDQKANMLDYLILKAKSAFGEQDYLQKLLDMVSDSSLKESIRIDISVALDRHLQVLEGNPDTYYRAKWLREQNAAASQPVRRTVSLALNTLRLWDMAKHQAGALGMIVTQDMRNRLEETKAVMGMELSDEELVQSEDGTEDQIEEEEQDDKPMTAVQKTKEFLFGSRGINEAKRKGKKIEKIDTVSKAYNFIKRIEERIKNCK